MSKLFHREINEESLPRNKLHLREDIIGLAIKIPYLSQDMLDFLDKIPPNEILPPDENLGYEATSEGMELKSRSDAVWKLCNAILLRSARIEKLAKKYPKHIFRLLENVWLLPKNISKETLGLKPNHWFGISYRYDYPGNINDIFAPASASSGPFRALLTAQSENLNLLCSSSTIVANVFFR